MNDTIKWIIGTLLAMIGLIIAFLSWYFPQETVNKTNTRSNISSINNLPISSTKNLNFSTNFIKDKNSSIRTKPTITKEKIVTKKQIVKKKPIQPPIKIKKKIIKKKTKTSKPIKKNKHIRYKNAILNISGHGVKIIVNKGKRKYPYKSANISAHGSKQKVYLPEGQQLIINLKGNGNNIVISKNIREQIIINDSGAGNNSSEY